MLGKLKGQKGITLIALTITVVTLLILSGVIIYNVINYGIIDNATSAKLKSDIKQVYEQVREEINNRKLAGEDVSLYEGKLQAFAELQNVEEEIIDFLYVSKGEVKYLKEKVEKYCEGNQKKLDELLQYFDELNIEEFTEVVATTGQQVSDVIITVGNTDQEIKKTIINKTITKYEYDVCMVLDLSGSMRWSAKKNSSTQLKYTDKNQRLYIAKQAMCDFIDEFFATRTGAVQVITFNKTPDQVGSSTDKYCGTMRLVDTGLEYSIAKNATDGKKMKTAIQNLQASSGTYYNYALEFAKMNLENYFEAEPAPVTTSTENAYEIVNTTEIVKRKKMLIFISDGYPTDSEKTIRATSTKIKNSGIDMYTIGFGFAFNLGKNGSKTAARILLEDMASKRTNGTPLTYVASGGDNAVQELIDSLKSILEESDVTGGTGEEIVETVISAPAERKEEEVKTTYGEGKTILEYPITNGYFDKTTPIEIWVDGHVEKDENGNPMSYYINNLPESITYDTHAVYWDLSKVDKELLDKNPTLRFTVVTYN